MGGEIMTKRSGRTSRHQRTAPQATAKGNGEETCAHQDVENTRFRIRDGSIFGRVKQRMRDWFYEDLG